MEEQEVPLEDVHENIRHHAHEAGGWIAMVALTTALLAALAAVASLLAGHHANEAMVSHIQAADQWGFYQAKGIKAEIVKTRMDLVKAMGRQPDAADVEQLKRYADEQAKIQNDAEEKQREAKASLREHVILSRGVTMFQIAIAIGAISVLTKRRLFWGVSLIFGVAGIVFLAQGLLAHG